MPKSFLDLPVEINLQILGQCGPNDVACLSLTCKYLWNLSQGFLIPCLSLSTADSRLCSPRQLNDKVFRWATAPELPPEGHRYRCHAESRAASLGHVRVLIEDLLDGENCKTLCWLRHCECYLVTLYKRLEGWMPPHLKFCHNCRKFTYRCSKDNRHCGMNIRRAKYELAEAGQWRMRTGITMRNLDVREREALWARTVIDLRMNAESSQMGAANSKEGLEQMQRTWELMQKEGIEDLLRRREEDLQKREEEVMKREGDLKKWENDLKMREDELWRRDKDC